MKISLPKYVLDCINLLNKQGYECNVVGGAIRDLILGKEVNDFDLSTNAIPSKVKEIFSDFKVLTIGEFHGTITLVIDKNKIEITTYRKEEKYIKNRKPSKVLFVNSIIDDLKRRDFTINAIAYNQKTGFIDFFNGMSDIENKIIKTIGNPDLRFNEDALRILRAIRFELQLSFDIEDSTKKSMFKNAYLLKNISYERLFLEINKMIEFDTFEKSIVEYKNIFKFIIPKLNTENIKGNKTTKLAMLLKNYTRDELINLKLDKKTVDEIVFLNEYSKHKINNIEDLKKLMSINDKYINNLIILNKVKYNKDISTLYNIILSQNHPYKLNHLKINGNDLISLKIEKEKISIILKLLLDYVINNPSENTHNKLKEYTKTLIQKANKN